MLEICHQTRRPVHFVLCHPEHESCDVDDRNNEPESGLMTLPWLPLEELLKRNLHRLQTQGKFVPANAIVDCCQRVEAMIPSNFSEPKSDGTYDSKMIEKHLVAIASPCFGGRGPRRHDNRRPGATFRYLLTKHRLVQKDYPRNDAVHSSKNYRQNNHNRNFGGRYNEGRGNGRGGRGRGRGNQGRYNDRASNSRIYDGDGGNSNGGDRNQGRPPPNQEEAPPRVRRRYNDTRNDYIR